MMIEEDGTHEIARRSRGTPRVANRLLRRVRDFAEVRHDGNVTSDVARAGLELFEVDEQGLDKLDLSILDGGGEVRWGPVGLSTLSAAVGEESDTIEDVVEPYLLQLELLQRTPRAVWLPSVPTATSASRRTVSSRSPEPRRHLNPVPPSGERAVACAAWSPPRRLFDRWCSGSSLKKVDREARSSVSRCRCS